jgi:hypothetical protein
VAEESPASLAAGMYKVWIKYGGCTTAFISEKISVSRTRNLRFTLANRTCWVYSLIMSWRASESREIKR